MEKYKLQTFAEKRRWVPTSRDIIYVEYIIIIQETFLRRESCETSCGEYDSKYTKIFIAVIFKFEIHD